MITAGLDCGAKNTKVIILKEGKVLGKGMILSGFDQKASSEEAFDQALRAAGIGRGDVTRVFASGAGMKEAVLAQGTVTELTAVAKAAVAFFPKAKTVIDVGAEEGRAIRTDEKGSDVNLATYLLMDGFQGDYEVAVVVSNDSDLLEPIKVVRNTLGLRVGLLNAHENPSLALLGVATFYKRIRKGLLQASQFPDTFHDAHGTITKPAAW